MAHSQLLYVSQAKKTPDISTLSEIRRSALRYNSSHGITGALCYAFGRFIQVLEGPAYETNRLYAKILTDSRHERVILIRYTTELPPLFTTWAMKTIYLHDSMSKESSLLVKYNNFGKFEPEEWSADKAVEYLAEVVRIIPEIE